MSKKLQMPLVLWFSCAGLCFGADREWVRVSDDRRSFVLAESGRKFTPWGFNYDHEGDGRLLEDYWDERWPTVETAFQEMKQLGANVVRIHLQFGKFMESPTEPRTSALDRLTDLIGLAERTGLYLDVTGLGCYDKEAVPEWYEELSEQARWEAQAVFWDAVAGRCAGSPAIFCYDLMNEPVVPGGDKKRDDWLGPGFGGKHFTQFISLDRAGRERPEIAREWIHTLVTAIRKRDERHLLTVGLVPWSLERPGLTSGFVPDRIAGDLDFIAVHLYPEKGKVDEAIETLKGFSAAGKPVVIEEMFTLKCGADELGTFIDRSKAEAAGWIGFYWGTTPEEYRQKEKRTIGDAITLNWLELFEKKTSEILWPYHAAVCDGAYPHHLQGICVDAGAIYWSFTTQLVKTDLDGKLLQKIPVANHHGDLCFYEGKLFVAVNLGKFNDPQGNADSWVYVYDAETLKETGRHKVPEAFYGAGGIGVVGGHFFVVGGLPEGVEENYVYEYDGEFRFVEKHVIASGHTHLGIQTAAFAGGRWWFGCYGAPKVLLVTDRGFRLKGRYEYDCSLGIVGLPEGGFLSARGRCESGKGCTGSVVLAEGDESEGLAPVESAPVSFEPGDGSLQILVGGRSIAEYVFEDEHVLRPYFRHLRTLSGKQVTRTHPPGETEELNDHPTMHPGLWMAFGDLNGADFWRNKGRVRHVEFLKQPEGGRGRGSFTVRNSYETEDGPICTEDCEIAVVVRPDGYLLNWSSQFHSDRGDFAFGDQEEMGLGVRVRTPLAVAKGGTIEDSEGRRNGAEVWGKQAEWCEYRGVLDGERVGVVLMPSPRNFRRSWFHARDYGLLAANPFGRNAFTRGGKSRIPVRRGDTFHLGFGVLVYDVPAGASPDIEGVYRRYVNGFGR